MQQLQASGTRQGTWEPAGGADLEPAPPEYCSTCRLCLPARLQPTPHPSLADCPRICSRNHPYPALKCPDVRVPSLCHIELGWPCVWRNTPASLVRSPLGASAHPVNTGKNDFLQIHHLTFFSNFCHLPSRILNNVPSFHRANSRDVSRTTCDKSVTILTPERVRPPPVSRELDTRAWSLGANIACSRHYYRHLTLLCDATPASPTHPPDSSTRFTHLRRSRLHHWHIRCRRNLRRGIRQTFVAFLYCSPLRYAGWRVYIHPPTHQATSSVHRQRHHPSLVASRYCQ